MSNAIKLMPWFLVFAGAALPSSTWACRTLVPNDAGIADHEGVVVVSIESGTRLDNPGWNVWKLRSRRLEAVSGSTARRRYTFVTAQSSRGCGVAPLPAAGEKCVVYFDRAAPAKVVEAFPLSVVRQHDPRLASIR